MAADADLDDLIRHIVDVHHVYVRSITPVIGGWLDEIVEGDDPKPPEAEEVRRLFADLSEALATHMAKEEHILFPFIEDLAVAARSGTRPPGGPFGTLLNPIKVMEADHFEAEAILARLRDLTHGWTVPENAGATCRRCYEELARFDADLERHVSLENDVLFPGAIALEGRLN